MHFLMVMTHRLQIAALNDTNIQDIVCQFSRGSAHSPHSWVCFSSEFLRTDSLRVCKLSTFTKHSNWQSRNIWSFYIAVIYLAWKKFVNDLAHMPGNFVLTEIKIGNGGLWFRSSGYFSWEADTFACRRPLFFRDGFCLSWVILLVWLPFHTKYDDRLGVLLHSMQ